MNMAASMPHAPVAVTYQTADHAVIVQCSTVQEQNAVRQFAKDGGFACPAPVASRPQYHCIAKTHPGGEVLWG